MIVRFFKTGTSRGELPVNYLLGDKSHDGAHRSEKPEVIAGTPQLTIDLINGIKRMHKYSSGCLAFRPQEQPNTQELHDIINKFMSVVAPNSDPDTINSLFVLHRDPPDKKTGLAGFHVHFIIPMVRLDGAHAGKRWNPHPPGKESIELMSLFTSTTNHEMGWKQVQPNPLRVNIDSFWRKVEGKPATRKADLLKHELDIAVSTGKLKNRDELCNFIANDLGLQITRNGSDYLSVKFPFSSKAMRLKGPLFDKSTNYERLLSANSHLGRSVILTDLEYQTHNQRFSQLLQKRGQLLAGLPISTISKEKNNGDNQHERKQQQRRATTTSYPRRVVDRTRQTTGIHNGANRILHEPNRPNVSKSTISHKLIGAHKHSAARLNGKNSEIGGREQFRNPSTTNNTGGNNGNTYGEPSSSSQQRGCSQEHIGATREIIPADISSLILKSVNSAEEINDQLRQLGMALSTAPLSGQVAIHEKINQLIGRRERLAKP